MSTPIHQNPFKTKQTVLRLLWLIPVLVFGILAVPAILYYGGGFILTRQVDNLYTERDCASLLKPVEYVEKFYPVKIAPFTDPARAQATECRAYLKADTLHKNKDWKAAYEAYLAYQAAHPKGIYTKEAHDFAADSLFELAFKQRAQQDFSSAVDNLALLIEKFSDTPTISKTKSALPEVYLEWGQECRAESEFTEAETVYLSLTTWATDEEEQPYIERAQTELSQTYFDWGKELQKEKDFSLANSKFDKAIAADPNPNSTNSVSAQIRTYLPGFQRAWGEHLISQGKYPEAIEHYKTSVKLSASKDTISAKDALAKAYLHWADALRKKEDYNHALTRINDAREAAATDNSRKNAEDALASTLDLFSKSKGSQAQKLITDVTNSICQSGKPLEALPIIGISDEKRLVISGLNLSLPSNILAQTPGSLHFVTCVEAKEVTLQTCPYSKTGYGTMTHWIKRIRYEWQVKVYRTQNGSLLTQKTFQGSAPNSCPWSYTFSSTTDYFYGKKPSETAVTDWLATLLK
jgi:tetratricopeptide (TPR) repeat protein